MIHIWVTGGTILEALFLFEGLKGTPLLRQHWPSAENILPDKSGAYFSQSKDFEKISLISQLNIVALVICHHANIAIHSGFIGSHNITDRFVYFIFATHQLLIIPYYSEYFK